MSDVTTLIAGLACGESPRWHENRLWLSNWGAEEIVAVEVGGRRESMVHVPFFPFSFDWLPDGRMLITSGRDGLVRRADGPDELTLHADLSGLSGGWNEIVVDSRGNAYINGGGFDVLAGAAFAPGIIALVGLDGSVHRVADGLAFPNGMVVTRDNSTLIVAESYGKRLSAYDIEADGSLRNRRVWADLVDGVPDGICLDAEDAIWYADVPNQRCVRVREGGEVTRTVELGRGCFACMLGGPQRRTLYMLTAEWRGMAKIGEMFAERTGQVLTVAVDVEGAGRP